MIERVEGKFPDGGTWATKLYLDADWKDCAKEDAVNVIMSIYNADDVMVQEIVGTPKTKEQLQEIARAAKEAEQ